MLDDWFEPGFLLRVECDLKDEEFSEWFFRANFAIGVEKVSIAMGKLDLNIITIGPNDGHDPELHNMVDGYLYYRYSIEAYRRDPLPEREILIEEQVKLCQQFIASIEEEGWLYGIIGEVKQFL